VTVPAAATTRTAVVRLSPGSPAPPKQLGGKGASLDRLVQAGFPVPPTAVVTADAYRAVAAHPSLAGLLTRLRAGANSHPGPMILTALWTGGVPTSSFTRCRPGVATDPSVAGTCAARPCTRIAGRSRRCERTGSTPVPRSFLASGRSSGFCCR
jgi:hypothetical protein